MDSELVLSVVIPICNEEEILPQLYDRTVSVLKRLGESYEVIFVNDCSSDNSLELMKVFNQENPKIKALSFSRNFGHQTAVTAGLNFSVGRAVMVMDGDLQDPPEIIPKFVEKWKEGYEVVYGVRTKRKENFFKRGLYKIYYRLLRMLSKTDIALDSGDCCLMDRKVVNLLNRMSERNRFIRGLRSWVGFRQIGLQYERDKRLAGKAKYTFFKLLELGLNGVISFSEIPLRMSIFVGFFTSVLSVIYSLYMALNRIVHPENQVPGWTSIVVGVTFLGGVQLMVLGFLGEYIVRIFDEVKGRPQYILNDVIGFKHDSAKDISSYSST